MREEKLKSYTKKILRTDVPSLETRYINEVNQQIENLSFL